MNKKFLSTVLFGALLLGSASTFVSCKDYDDDIQNLQTQVNDVKAAVAALEAKIGNGKLVTGVSSTATGITISLSDGSSYTVTNGKDGVDGAPGAAGADAQQITINEETGELMINGEGTGIKPATEVAKEEAKAPVKAEGGFWYVLNEEGEYDNTNIPVSGITVTGNDLTGYTLTITTAEGTKVIKLPTASSTLESVTMSGNGYFTDPGAGTGIIWTAAKKAITWAGPKGNIAEGDLLIGQVTNQIVAVTPASYALDQQELALVASDGTVAPVAVTAKAEEGVLNTTRAAQNGQFILSVAMDETITAENIADAFATMVGTNARNLKYALTVNGKVVTPYNFVIDTQTTAESKTNNMNHSAFATNLTLLDGSAIGNLVPGTTTSFKYSNGLAYDAYLSFEGTHKAKAANLGVVADGMNITAPENVYGESLTVTIHVIDILGKITTTTKLLTFEGATVSVDTTAEAVSHVVAPLSADREEIIISVAGLFDGLTEAQIESVTGSTIKSVTEETGEFPYSTSTAQYVKKIAANGTKTAFNWANDDLRDLKYIVIPATHITNNNAKPGDYTLVLTLKNGSNEITKIEMPVEITLPTFDEIFTKSGSWTDDVLTLRLTDGSNSLDFTNAYSFDYNSLLANMSVDFEQYDSDSNGEIDASDNMVATFASTTGQVTVVTSETVDADGAVVPVTAETIYKIDGQDNFALKSGEYTVKFISPLDGATMTYLKNAAAANFSVSAATGTVNAFVAGVAPATKDQGLAVIFKNGKYALNDALFTNCHWSAKLDVKAGATAAANVNTDGTISLTNLAQGTYTTKLTITMTDYFGIVSTFTIDVDVNY